MDTAKEKTMNVTDILVHVHDTLQPGQRREVEDTLRTIDGIIAPRFVPDRDHFMMVAYNPEKMRSDNLRQAFNHMGLQAKLIGM
jgi:hypothetical protein